MYVDRSDGLDPETAETLTQCLDKAETTYLGWVAVCLDLSEVANPPARSPRDICVEVGENAMFKEMFMCLPR